MSIYKLMEKDLETYCLMSAIAFIEEMSKPNPHVQIKKYKDKEYCCTCYRSIRLKMNDPEVVKKMFRITKGWEGKINKILIGKSFINPRKENWSNQDFFYFSPIWLNLILNKCGKIPNRYSFESAKTRVNKLVQYKKMEINKNKFLFNKLFKNKNLAAGAFIISMDLECRGIQQGKVSLCMSEKYKDFLKFMFKIAQKWNWTNNKKLSKVSIEYNKKLGINASPQYEFGININGLKEIYNIAGPLANSHKNKCVDFHVKRSDNYTNKGYYLRKNKSKEKILKKLIKNRNLTTTDLQFITKTRADVVLDHLHKLEKDGKIKKERKGKRYIWNIK